MIEAFIAGVLVGGVGDSRRARPSGSPIAGELDIILCLYQSKMNRINSDYKLADDDARRKRDAALGAAFKEYCRARDDFWADDARPLSKGEH